MITVFTPTYNRRDKIERLYRSLLTQTSFDFEWLVVDDGSTDETEVYFQELSKSNAPFSIRYIRQQNGGKHRAINMGVKNAQGDLFFIVDSDDYLMDTAIEKLLLWQQTLGEQDRCAGISGLRGYTTNTVIGDKPLTQTAYIDATNIERDQYKLRGGKAEAYFTKVLLRYPFPEFEGETFLTEETIWNKIAEDGYFIRWYNEIIYICKYLEGGLTKSGIEKYKKNPQGTLYWAKGQIRIFSKKFKKRAQAIERYYQCVKGQKTLKEIAKDLDVSVWQCRKAIITLKAYKMIKKIFRR